MTDNVIKISLIETNFLTRWQCHVCGGATEKDPVLAEGDQDIGPSGDGKGREHRTIRICDQCLKGDDGLSIDQRLERLAMRFDTEAGAFCLSAGRPRSSQFAQRHEPAPKTAFDEFVRHRLSRLQVVAGVGDQEIDLGHSRTWRSISLPIL